MALEPFMMEKNVEPKAKAKVEWDGKDFRGVKCKPQSINFLRQHPKVYEWLEVRSEKYINTAVCYLKQFFEWARMTPEQWLSLNEKEARNKAWVYIRTIRIDHSAKARIFKGFIKRLYLYVNERALPFIPGKHDITYVPQRIKYRMDKATCWKIIHKTRNLRDEAILTMAFECGLRRNAVTHLTFGHFKNFMWFKKNDDGEVVRSNEAEGNIAIFKVMAKKTKQYTNDNKLRGKLTWYYGCLHKEATKILKDYVRQYHENSNEDRAFWYSHRPRDDKNKPINELMFWSIIKDCVKRAGLPHDQINFHSLRRGFRSVVRNTSGITDNEFKEAIMGHKLRGAEEAYFDKDPLEFAREYAKCDFSEPHAEKDRKIERLQEEVKALSQAQVETKKKLTIPSGPLGGSAPEEKKRRLEAALKQVSPEEPKRDFQQAKPQLPKSEPLRHTKPIQKTHVSTKPIGKDDWVVCPDKDDWVRKSVECKKCGQENFKKFKDCWLGRRKNPFSDLFECSKPKPSF